MNSTVLIFVTVVALYAMFRAVTSTIDLIFKIVIGILILSFLGYTFAGWEEISAPAALDAKETQNLLYPQENDSIEMPSDSKIEIKKNTTET